MDKYWCPDCHGNPELSTCCESETIPVGSVYKCCNCGKFCKVRDCDTCLGVELLTKEELIEVGFTEKEIKGFDKIREESNG